MSEGSAAPQTSRLAISALILGLVTCVPLVMVGLLLTTTFRGSNEYNTLVGVAILAFPVPDIATLVLTVLAWRRIQKSEGRLKGRGFTLGGLLLGIAVPLLIGGILLGASAQAQPVCLPAPPPASVPGGPPC